MVVIGKAVFGKRAPQEFAKTPLHPVADNRIANLLGNGDPVSYALAPVGPGQQNESRLRISQALIGGQKIRALRKNLLHSRINNAYGPPLGARKFTSNLAKQPLDLRRAQKERDRCVYR